MPDDERIKFCPGCESALPRTAFRPRPERGPDAVHPRCRKCANKARRLARKAASPEEQQRALKVARQWKRDHSQKNLETKRAWEAAHPEQTAGYARRQSRKQYAKDPAARIAASLASRAKKPEQYKAYDTQWRLDNAPRCRAKYKAYMARKQQALPAWADDFLIQQFYDCCTERNQLQTGSVDWHVDHIVPLNSPLVCGLHVHDNLQVIPGILNLSKGNRYWPDMP